MSDVLTRSHNKGRLAEHAYTLFIGVLMIIGWYQHWTIMAVIAFCGVAGLIQFATDSICTTIRETKQ